MEPKIQEPTLEERKDWEYEKKKRELQIGRMRATLVRGQITQAYEILENIRFDYLSDTAFRDKIVKAKKGCELAIGDFLLDDCYWKGRIEKHHHITPAELWEEQNNPVHPTDDAGFGSEAKRQND